MSNDATLSAPDKALTNWRPIETAPCSKTVLTQHIEDLYPVPAYQVVTGTWYRETEGPEDSFYGAERHCPLYRTPTHWMPLPTGPTASD